MFQSVDPGMLEVQPELVLTSAGLLSLRVAVKAQTLSECNFLINYNLMAEPS